MAEERKQSPDAAAPAKPPRDHRQEITDRMVAALEQGIIPWEKLWEGLEHGLPRNMVSDRPYGGGNRMILMLHQMDRGHADPRYATVKQINELGGRVNKGEKGVGVELWKDQPFWERRDVEVSLNKMRVKIFEEGTAPDRQTLHIDPAGHDYARYVGIPEADVQRVMEKRSLAVSGQDCGAANGKGNDLDAQQVPGVPTAPFEPGTPTQPLQPAIAERVDIPRHAGGRVVLPDDRRQAAEASVAQLDPITDGALFRVGQVRGTELDRVYLGRAGLLDADGDLPQAIADMICVQAAIREKVFTAAFGPDKAATLLNRMDDPTLKAVAEDPLPAHAMEPEFFCDHEPER